MSYTQADLDALYRAKASGASSVRYGDPPRLVMLRSKLELDELIAEVRGELYPEQKRTRRRRYAQGVSGW